MIEEKLKKLIIERYGSLVAFSEKIGLPNSTIDSILRRGIGKGKVENVISICKELQISIDGLRHNVIKPVTFENISREEFENHTHKKCEKPEKISAKELFDKTRYLVSITEDLSDKEKQHFLLSIELIENNSKSKEN